jgi:hypothetical protein
MKATACRGFLYFCRTRRAFFFPLLGHVVQGGFSSLFAWSL